MDRGHKKQHYIYRLQFFFTVTSNEYNTSEEKKLLASTVDRYSCMIWEVECGGLRFPILKLRGKGLPEPDPREPSLVKPRRLGSLLEPDVLKLD